MQNANSPKTSKFAKKETNLSHCSSKVHGINGNEIFTTMVLSGRVVRLRQPVENVTQSGTGRPMRPGPSRPIQDFSAHPGKQNFWPGPGRAAIIRPGPIFVPGPGRAGQKNRWAGPGRDTSGPGRAGPPDLGFRPTLRSTNQVESGRVRRVTCRVGTFRVSNAVVAAHIAT